jgi:hypothetical protein
MGEKIAVRDGSRLVQRTLVRLMVSEIFSRRFNGYVFVNLSYSNSNCTRL